jgi:hypothetical protein
MYSAEHPVDQTPTSPPSAVPTEAEPPSEPAAVDVGNGATRERSTVKFPYGDLNDAVEVARAISQGHGLSCTVDQLAASLGQTVSGAFRTKVATAQTFGAVEVQRGQVLLTTVGTELADPDTEEPARVTAFLNVELYEKMYDLFKGRMLPADKGLTAEMIRAGVAPKQAARARQAFHRSADQAGFYRAGRGRLVEPSLGKVSNVTVVEGRSATATEQDKATSDGLRGHPMIVGLWHELPRTKGWSGEERRRWFEAARIMFDIVYGPAPDDQSVTPATEHEQPS